MSRYALEERVAASFEALATGDAVGKQTETLSRADVLRWYPQGVIGFAGQPGTVIPRYAGKPYQWRIAEVTDDTEQTIAVARSLMATGAARHESIGAELMRCRKSVHPGVRIWEFQQTGDPARMALAGDGCGAAMRVAPVGTIIDSDDRELLVNAAYEASISTHGGALALSAAAAVAAAVSTALGAGTAKQVLSAALDAARLAERLHPAETTVTISRRIEEISLHLAAQTCLTADGIAQSYFPDQPATIVPLAISLAVVTESAKETTLLAANTGGDADSVASIGSAIAGALSPASVDHEWFRAVRAVNPGECDELLALAAALARRRPSR